MRNLLLLVYVLMSPYISFAQNEQQEINAIKSDTNFLYSTGTSISSAEEAYENAKDLLGLEIEQWLKENHAQDITGYVAKSKEKMSRIQTKRGNLFRVFAYVNKSEILTYLKDENVVVVELGGSSAGSSKETGSLKKMTENPVSTKPLELQSTVEKISGTNVVVLGAPSTNVLTSYERRLLEIKRFTMLNDFINQGRADETIVEIGKYSNLPKSGVVYAFIHNREGDIEACMKVLDGEAINMLTGNKENISTYKGCGAIWIKVKN